MEKEKGTYEEKAIRVIQRATQEKTEALSKTETLQVRWYSALLEQVLNHPNINCTLHLQGLLVSFAR